MDATVALPGSKSLTNRALVLAALASEPSRIRRPLRARDTVLMVAALRALGVRVDEEADDLVVRPRPLRGGGRVDCGLAGTVMRFVPPVAALADGTTHFDGDDRARQRPVAAMIAALRRLGAKVDDGGRGSLPFSVVGHGEMGGGAVTVDASASSQLVSGLLLAAPAYRDGLDLTHAGPPLPSLPHVAMTVTELRRRRVRVDGDHDRWMVAPGPVSALDVEIEPDLSSAAPFLAAAVVTGGRVRVERWPRDTDQAGDRLREILPRFGARVRVDGDGLEVLGPRWVSPVDLDLHDVGELTPVLAGLCAMATGPSRLSGVGHLRGHETDRLAALATELSGLGVRVEQTADTLTIRPGHAGGLRPGLFHAYADHRLAQLGAVLGLVVPGVEVDDIASTDKTFPGFVAAWSAMLR